MGRKLSIHAIIRTIKIYYRMIQQWSIGFVKEKKTEQWCIYLKTWKYTTKYKIDTAMIHQVWQIYTFKEKKTEHRCIYLKTWKYTTKYKIDTTMIHHVWQSYTFILRSSIPSCNSVNYSKLYITATRLLINFFFCIEIIYHWSETC